MWGSTTGCLEYAGVLIQHVQGESDRVRQEKRMKRKIRTRQCMGSRDENIRREGGRDGRRKRGREGRREERREGGKDRVGSLHICFVNLNTRVGKVQAT